MRHEKLGDSSNRYRHTCRGCGEDFPKGRNEVLVGHLIKRCPAISEHDRRKAVSQVAGSGEGRSYGDTSINNVSVTEHELSMIQASIAQHAANQALGSPGMDSSALSAAGANSRSALDILGDVAAREGGRAGQIIAEEAPMYRSESPSTQLRQQLDFDDRNNLFAPQNSGVELLAGERTTEPGTWLDIDQDSHRGHIGIGSERAGRSSTVSCATSSANAVGTINP